MICKVIALLRIGKHTFVPAYFVSLPNFEFEMKIRNSGFNICDSDSIRNQLRFGYGHP